MSKAPKNNKARCNLYEWLDLYSHSIPKESVKGQLIECQEIIERQEQQINRLSESLASMYKLNPNEDKVYKIEDKAVEMFVNWVCNSEISGFSQKVREKHSQYTINKERWRK